MPRTLHQHIVFRCNRPKIPLRRFLSSIPFKSNLLFPDFNLDLSQFYLLLIHSQKKLGNQVDNQGKVMTKINVAINIKK